MKTFSRTYFLVYWFLPILVLSGEVLSAKGKLKLVKKVKVGPVSLHSHHSPECPGPDCKSNGEPDDKSRLKRNNVPVMNGGGPQQWQQPQQQQSFPQFNQPQQQQQQFPVPQDNLMTESQPIPVMDLGHFEPSAAAPQMQPQFGGMPMARSDNGQGMNGPGDQFQNPSGGPPSNNFQGPSGPGNSGPGGFQQNPIPFGPQPDSNNNGFPMNSQPSPGMPQNQNQQRFGEPMEQQGGGFQEGNFNFQNNDPSGQNNFQGPQQFNNQQPNNNAFPPNQFQNPNGPQFPQGNNPPDQFGASSFQQQSFNGEPGFPQGDPNNPNAPPPQFPPQNQFPPTQMNNNNNNNGPSFPNQPQMNPNFNGPPMKFPPMNREFPQGHPGGPHPLPGPPGFPLVSHQNPLMAPHFQNAPNPQQFQGHPFPTNSSYAPRTNAAEDSSGDSRDSNGGEYNDGYDEQQDSETLIQAYHDDEYDEDYKNKWKQGLFRNKHKGNVNEDQVVSFVVQIAWKIISSYIFVFVANMLIGFLGKATGLSDSYVETHITLGNEGKHPFGNYGDGGKGPGPPSVGGSHYGSPGTTGSKKGQYSLSNGFYHPATALYQQPTYQYSKGGTEYALHGYDQYHAVKYAKKFSKKYAKKSGKYGLRPKPIGPYLPAYQYGLPPGPLAGGWTAGSGGPNGFYKRTGESDELKKDKKKNPKEKDSSGRNGDGISITKSSSNSSNSTETEDSEESDEDEAATSTASAANETSLSFTTVPTVETTLEGAMNDTSGESDKSSTAEESGSVEDDEGNEATTTLLPIVSEDENDLIQSSTTTTTAATPVSLRTSLRNETAEDNSGLMLFKTGTRSNSRVFNSLKAQ